MSLRMPGLRWWRKTPEFPDHSERFDDVNDAYLTDVESGLEGFGDTGQRGFSDAWGSATPVLDEAAAAFASDETDTRGRDLDAGSRRWKVALLIVIVAGAAAGVLYSQGVFDGESAGVAEAAAVPTLAAPDEIREYESTPTEIDVSIADVETSMFVETSGGLPEPVGDANEELAADVTVGLVIWGDRLHVAITGLGVGNADRCVIASLVAPDLRAIDVATMGSCDVDLAATGDRVACVGANALLLEVWPFDPRSPVRPPEATAIRVRIQDRLDDESVLSQRGTLALPQDVADNALLRAATVLGGSPGQTISVDGRSCTLVDRSDILIQLLPS